MKTLILTGFDAGMKELGELCLPSKESYAARHGCDLRVLTDAAGDYPPKFWHPSFQKLRHILAAFGDGYDIVFWIDADTVVTNPAIGPLGFLSGIAPQFFTVSGDYKRPSEDPRPAFNQWSAGQMVWMNRRGARDFLRHAITQEQFAWSGLWDQDAMQDLTAREPNLGPRILPPRAMNSVLPGLSGDFADWQPGDFCCHLTGIDREARLGAAFEFIGKHLPRLAESQPSES